MRGGSIHLLSLIACSEFGFDPIEEEGPTRVVVAVTEVFVVEPAASVDLLVVVDDTASMAQELEALANEVEVLFEGLEALSLDWQVGVISADLDGAYAGWLRGSPYVISPTLPDPAGAFSARMPVAGGVGESGIGAARRALELSSADGPNAGFLRPGSRLELLFLSDADDVSPGVDPVGDLIDVLPVQAAAFAIVGPSPLGCASAIGSAQPGTRYLDLVDAIGGGTQPICDGGFALLLDELAADSVVLTTRYPLFATPVNGTVGVKVDGASLPEDATALEGNVLVFAEPPAAGAVIEVRYARTETGER